MNSIEGATPDPVSPTTPESAARELTDAALRMDWQQVVLNGGPPCFRLEGGGRFCGRAVRWHSAHTHGFVSLADLIREAERRGVEREREACARIAETHPFPGTIMSPADVDRFGCGIAAAIRARAAAAPEGEGSV